MPVLAEFSPQGQPGQLAAVGRGIDDANQSWMDRSQARRIREAQEQRQAAEFEIVQPVLQAKANADKVKLATDLEAAKAMQDQRATAYVLKPNADRFFNDIITETNPDVREGLARDWLGSYAQLENVAEFQPEMKSKKDILAKILTETSAIRSLDLKNQAALEVQTAKQEAADTAAKLKADFETERQTRALEHALALAKARTESAERIAGTRAAATVQSAETRADATVKAAETRTQHTFELEKMKALRDEAIDAGDEESAAIFEGRIRKINAIAGEESAPLARPAPRPKVDALYIIEPGQAPKFSPNVKTPQDILKAVQQMVDDGVMDAAQGRETLVKLGFKPKQ